MPVSITPVEQFFLQLKMIKTRFRNSLSGRSYSSLMNSIIKSPNQLSEGNLRAIVENQVD